MNYFFGRINTDRLIRVLSCALIVFSIITVWLTIPAENRFAHQADEGYYFMYARAIKTMGISHFSVLLKHHFEDRVAQYFPHPARIGHVLLTSFWLRIFPETFTSLAILSFTCFVVFLILSFFYCRKYFGANIAWLYCVFLSAYPLSMASARRVLQDSVLNLFWAVSFWLFLDFIFEKKKSKFILYLFFFSVSLTIKEASVVMFPFFVVCFLIEKLVYKGTLRWSYLAGMFLWPFLSVAALYLCMLGGWRNVLDLCRFILGVHFPNSVVNAYSLYAIGPWYKYIIDYLLLSPYTLLLAIGYLFIMAVKRVKDRKIVYPAVFLATVYCIMSSMKYTKIIRFILSLDIVISLFALFALMHLFNENGKGKKMLAVFLIVAVIYVNNYINYSYLFVRLAIYDPLSMWLLGAQKIIPVDMF